MRVGGCKGAEGMDDRSCGLVVGTVGGGVVVVCMSEWAVTVKNEGGDEFDGVHWFVGVALVRESE